MIASAAAPPAGYQLARASSPVLVASGGEGATVRVAIDLPPGYHLTDGAGSSYFTQVRGGPSWGLRSAVVAADVDEVGLAFHARSQLACAWALEGMLS